MKTLEKDLLDTITEIRALFDFEEEVFFSQVKNVYALRYLLIEAVEAMANICNHLLTRVTGQVPKGYPDCFERLSEASIITKELSEKLKRVASLRNLLIHKYWEIDDHKVFRSAKENVGDFEEFLRQVNKLLPL
ncbi:MAG TPA: DUF86 domain-containing protein [Thermodesulfobacteriota bacterium]|nr:DUF86 domain-containing protein [Thermodesulfobacteriota bacterium]